MPFNSGTGITDQIDMLDKLIEVVTSRYLSAVAVNAGGTGHAVGDIIGITGTGSTSTIVAQLEVTSVSTGVITGIRVYRSGAYTVDPTTTTGNAQSSTSGAGTGATFNLTFHAPTWTLNRRTQEAVSATIAAGGTGYTVGDDLTVVLGSGVSGDGYVAAQFNVDTVSAGAVTAVTVISATRGNYEEVPANPVSTTGGTGTGCTLNVTWGDPPQTRQNGQVAMLEGEGLAGTDAIHVMIKTYSQASGFDTAYNWIILGATGYNSTLPIHQQTGVNSTQINTSTGALPASDTGGCVMVLKNNDANPDISWWINHTGRRIILVCKVQGGSSTIYSSCYMGFLNQFGTDTEYPYPLAMIAGTNDLNRLWTDTTELTGGIVESFYNSATDPQGPGWVRTPAGTWLGFAAATSTSSSNRALETEFGVYPFINPDTLTGASQKVAIGDVGFGSGSDLLIPATGVPGTPGVQLKPTPGTGSSYYWLVPPIVMRMENAGSNLFPDYYNMFGEIDGVFWFHTGNNGVVSEDRFVLGTKRYSIFANGNRTQVWSYLALDED